MNYLSYISCIVVLALLPSCYEPVEGCLDKTATNFDLDADESCVDCCTYPKLAIRFDNKWQYLDTLLSFRTDTLFYDVNNLPFRINRIRFYWSNFSLVLNDGRELFTTDLLDVKIPDGSDTSTLNIIDHFLLADVGSATDNITLGNIQPDGIIKGLNVDFGIAQPINSAFSDQMPDNHVLEPQLGNMNYGSEIGYVFAKIELFKDTIATDTVPVIVNIFGDNALRSMSLNLDIPIILTEGYNPKLVIESNFAQWFEGVNIRTGDTIQMQNQIANNIDGSFTLKEVLAN